MFLNLFISCLLPNAFLSKIALKSPLFETTCYSIFFLQSFIICQISAFSSFLKAAFDERLLCQRLMLNLKCTSRGIKENVHNTESSDLTKLQLDHKKAR